ncbi:hypothetical protein [Sphingomonas oryzagri]
MPLANLFVTDQERRLAREQALYALEDHGDEAEQRLRQKAEQTRSRSHRRIYRLAINEVRKLQR